VKTPVNCFVFYKYDDDTYKHVLNLSNYNKDNKDGSQEAAHVTSKKFGKVYLGTLGGEDA
jgi:hypothetical protein